MEKNQEIWGVPVGAPELKGLTDEEREEMRRRSEKAAREAEIERQQRLGLPPR